MSSALNDKDPVSLIGSRRKPCSKMNNYCPNNPILATSVKLDVRCDDRIDRRRHRGASQSTKSISVANNSQQLDSKIIKTYRLQRLCPGIAASTLLRRSLAAGDIGVVGGILLRHFGCRDSS